MLQPFTKSDRDRLTRVRQGEKKIGQETIPINSLESLNTSPAPFVLLGIKEDIGIRANLGKAGARFCWDYAINAILNVQSNSFLRGDRLIVAGTLEFEDLNREAESLSAEEPAHLQRLREMTAEIDRVVAAVIDQIAQAGKIPIVIGGGHNNSFGNIAGTARALKKPLSVLNIDPHTDYRTAEGRHSGNGFRYADAAGHMYKYAVYGLHEGYNGEDIIDEFKSSPRLAFQTFESLLHKDAEERDQLFKNMLHWLENAPLGLELDLDSITGFPVSALNPSGFTLNDVRVMIRTAGAIKKPVYFHICEGSPERAASEQEKELLGKSIAYLVTDFIKAYDL